MSYFSSLQYKGIILYTNLLANPNMASLFLPETSTINVKRKSNSWCRVEHETLYGPNNKEISVLFYQRQPIKWLYYI